MIAQQSKECGRHCVDGYVWGCRGILSKERIVQWRLSVWNSKVVLKRGWEKPARGSGVIKPASLLPLAPQGR